jgi:hypothetical protein
MIAADKKTIGVIPRNQPMLNRLVAAGMFATESDAAKFAFALAVKKDTPPGSVEGADTKWNVGTFDTDQSLRLIVEAMYEGTREPYRLIECLINRGLELIDDGTDVPPDVFSEVFAAQA